MKGYAQVCPLSRAVEVVGERWTGLILRALLYGEQNFNSLRKSMSHISPTLLSERLKTLEQVNVIKRIEASDGISYRLTEAGEALRPVLLELGRWGAQFTESNANDPDLDVSHLLWEWPRRVDVTQFPPDHRVIYRFCVDGSKFPEFFLIIAKGGAKLILKLTKGMSPNMTLLCKLSTFARLSVGEQTFEVAKSKGDLVVHGEPHFWRLLKQGMQPNMFARTGS